MEMQMFGADSSWVLCLSAYFKFLMDKRVMEMLKIWEKKYIAQVLNAHLGWFLTSDNALRYLLNINLQSCTTCFISSLQPLLLRHFIIATWCYVAHTTIGRVLMFPARSMIPGMKDGEAKFGRHWRRDPLMLNSGILQLRTIEFRNTGLWELSSSRTWEHRVLRT